MNFFLLLEQVCTAAADVNRIDILDDCLHELITEFPGSLRVKRLQALKLEVAGKYEDAYKFMDEIHKLDEANPAPRKKKIALLKAMGNASEAMKELVEYVKTFQSDREAWQELSDLYLADGDYGRAGFCMEEIILLNPFNHLYHQRYADIRYTAGGVENLDLARAHYCLALKLCPSNMRALYGLLLCASNLSASQKTQTKRKESNKLVTWSLKRIEELYIEAESETSTVESLMAALQITC